MSRLSIAKVWLLLLSFALTSCAVIPTHIEQPRLDLADIEIQELGLLQQRYVLTLRAQNPNPVALPVRGVRYALDLEDRQFASGTSAEPFRLPAYGETDIRIEVSTNLLRTGQWLLERLQRGDTGLAYTIRGDLDINLAGVGRVPFENSGRVDLNLAGE